MKNILIFILLIASLTGLAQRSSNIYYRMTMDTGSTPPPSFIPEYDTLLARATTNGDTLPTLSYQVAQNIVLDTLTRYPIDFFYNYAVNSMGFSLYNQLDPDSNKATNIGATFLPDTGWVARINGEALNLHVNPSTDVVYYKEDTVVLGFWVKKIKQDDDNFFGANSGYDILIKYNTSNRFANRINGSSTLADDVTDISGQTGLLIIQRIGSDYKYWFDGDSIGVSSHVGGTSIPNVELGLMAMLNGTTPSNTVRYPFGACFIGGYLSEEEIGYITTTFNNYYSTIHP